MPLRLACQLGLDKRYARPRISKGPGGDLNLVQNTKTLQQMLGAIINHGSLRLEARIQEGNL